MHSPNSRGNLLTLVIISFGVHKLYNSMEPYMSFLGLFSMILWFFSESISLLLIIILCCFETGSHVVQAGLKFITLLLHLLCVEITGLHDNTWSIRVSWSILILLSSNSSNLLNYKIIFIFTNSFFNMGRKFIGVGKRERERGRKRKRDSDLPPQRNDRKSIFFLSNWYPDMAIL